MLHLLIDGNHLASRIRFSKQRSLSRSDGHLSGVIYGVLRNVGWVMNELIIQPYQIIICWDGGRSARRLEIYPGYKDREKKDLTPQEELEKKFYYPQIDQCIRGLATIGVRNVRVGGVEADDLVSIYTARLEEQDHQVVVYTGDHDMHQLVSPQVRILDTDGKLYDENALLKRWGLSSRNWMVFHKALEGDVSDTIKGVPGIGKKRVKEVVEHAALAFTDPVKPRDMEEAVWKLVEKCREHIDVICRNIELMLLPRSWEDSFYDDAQRETADAAFNNQQPRDINEFVDFCREWELQSILDDLYRW